MILKAVKFHQKGVGLLEVLIAILVLSVGLLGMASLQLNAMKFNESATVRTQANILAYNVVDRMRANRSVALAGTYNIGIDETPSGTTVASNDLIWWKQQLSQNLPEGKGSITQAGNIFTITISWDESRIEGDGAVQSFIYETRI